MRTHKATIFGILMVLLAACSFMPGTQVPRLGGQPTSMGVSYQPDKGSTYQPEMITMPLQVTTQPLKELAAEEWQSFRRPTTGSQPPAEPRQLSFSTQSQGSQTIQIPSSGIFQLIVQAGSRFQILQPDARSGPAQVQLPSGTLEAVLSVPAGSGPGQLQIQDSFYYLQDSLNPSEHERHFSLGLRPLPIPGTWHNPDQEHWVLNFQVQNLQGFELSWNPSQQSPPLPPGLAEIGPAGGSVELPGLAKLEVPAGALSQTQMVRLSQVLEAESLAVSPELDFHDNPMAGDDYLSPLVKMEPFGLTLNTPAFLYIVRTEEELAMAKVYGEDSPVFSILNTQDISWEASDRASRGLRSLSYLRQQQVFLFEPILIDKLGYAAKLILNGWKINVDASFQIQSDTSYECQQGLVNHSIIFKDVSTAFKEVWSDNFRLLFLPGTEDLLSDQDTCWTLRVFETVYDKLLNNKNLTLANILRFPSAENKYNSRIPIWIHPKIDGALGAFSVRQCDEKACEHYFSLSICPYGSVSTGCQFDRKLALETIAHEVLHLFQAGHVTTLAHAQLRKTSADKWFSESTASWFSLHFMQTEAGSLGFQNLNLLETDHAETVLKKTKQALSKPFFLEPENIELNYAYVGFFETLAHETNEDLIFEAVKIFAEKYIRDKVGGDNKTLLALDDALKARQITHDLSHYYARYSENALMMQNLLPVDGPFEPVELIQPTLDKIIAKSTTKKQAAHFEFVLDSTQTRYQLIKPHDTSPLKDRPLYIQVASIEPTMLGGKSVREHLNLQVQGVDNLTGETARFQEGQIHHYSTGDFQNLLNPEAEDTIKLESFGTEAEAKSVVLLAANGLWSSQTPITVKIEAYVDPEPLEILSSRTLSEAEDPTQTRFALSVANARCDLSECYVYMQVQSGGLARAKVERVLNNSTDAQDRPVQEVVVMAYNHARVGGTVFFMQDGLVSNHLQDAVYVCNMLENNSSCPATGLQGFCLNAQQAVPQKLRPCQRS